MKRAATGFCVVANIRFAKSPPNILKASPMPLMPTMKRYRQRKTPKTFTRVRIWLVVDSVEDKMECVSVIASVKEGYLDRLRKVRQARGTGYVPESVSF